ncbi:tandem-95 repeat protein, partial [Neptunomonas sp.]|uniref:tandem-95 repeat protein n=1 Tax=Neptunomonas sp. TaxID=1971898 RepID=UPI0025FBCC30
QEPPVAINDSSSTAEDTPVTITILSNDTDPDGNIDVTTVTLTSGPTNGSVVVNPDGTVTYTPNLNYNGADSFEYTVQDNEGNTSNAATVNLVIEAIEDVPIAVDDVIDVVEDSFVSASLAGNDTESDDGGNVWALATSASNGTIVVNADGTFTYTPIANFSGADSFTYTITDLNGDVSTATVTVNVAPVNDGAPVAADDAFTTLLGTPITITEGQLFSNDTLADHATISNVSNVSSGALVDNGNGTWTYTPVVAGPASFTYTLTDDDGETSTATVNLTVVDPVDDLATVHESALTDGTGGGTTVASGNILANDGGGSSVSNVNGVIDGGAGDADARAGYIGIDTSLGSLVVDSSGPNAGDYTYTLTSPGDNTAVADDLSVTDSFTYTSDTTSASIHINVADDQPLAFDRVVNVTEDALPDYNIVLVLDVSGSMSQAQYGGQVRQINADGSVTINTRLDLAKQAMAGLVTEYFNQAQNVSIKLVTFSDGANILNSNVAYTDKASAVSAISSINGSGSTNYESALDATQSAFGSVDNSVENLVYFISDGVPTSGNTSNPVGASGYDAFLAANSIKSYGVGVGTGISDTSALDSIHNVDSDLDGSVDSAIIVPDLNQLEDTLISTIPVAVGGNLVGSGNVNSALGADGGHVQQITIRLDSNADGTSDQDVTFSYNNTTGLISENSTFLTGFPLSGDLLTLDASSGFKYGALTFNFSTADYTYFTGGTAAQGDSFAVTFVAEDGDGDVTPAVALTFNVVDGQPIANADMDTLFGNHDSFEGNVITGLGTDGGLALGSKVTEFTPQGTGVDAAVDDAKVSSITFEGQIFDLAANISGSGAGYSYSISGGSLSWSHNTDGSSLVFNTDGYYQYTPPTADIPSAPTDTTVNVQFNNTNATGTSLTNSGVIMTGIDRDLTTDNSGVRTTSDGVGVLGGNNNSRIDNLETLVLNFDRSLYPNGVTNIGFNADNSNSSLGGSRALTYSVYHIDGSLLGQYYSNTEAQFQLPSEYSNVGRIEITASSDAYASMFSMNFDPVLIDASATEIAPVEIGYTLTDTNGDSSSTTLTLRTISNTIAGDETNNTDLIGTAGNDRVVGLAGNDELDGAAGNDILEGGDGNDILIGGLGHDHLVGGAGNDTLEGGSGNDLLVGGSGNDILSGDLGADIFQWSQADKGVSGSPSVDRITDFDSVAANSGGDVLDLSDLLQGEDASDLNSLLNYLHFEQVGADTVAHVSSNGGFSGGYNAGAEDQTIIFQNTDLIGSFTNDQQIIQDLLGSGKLIVD